jgi:Kef-type K+ transport system membrane component KefB
MTFGNRMKRTYSIALFLLLLAVPALAQAQAEGDAHTITHRMTMLVLELAVIILAARAGGYIFSRYLKQPAVLGELCAGMAIGPYALGGFNWPIVGQLFSLPHGMLPVSPELYGIATIASIVLLFLAGLETDISMFLRYSVAGTIVGIGGVVGSFFLQRKLDLPESVTVLAGAVIDDVLGIVILAIVVGIAKLRGVADGSINWSEIGIIAAKAIGFWIACTMLGLLLARKITRILKWFKSPEMIASMSMGLALLLAGLSEMAGLAMIIGAYIMGLSLSRTDVKHELHERLHGVYHFLVPIFFCVMGMLVDFSAMKGALIFGAVYSAVAVASKIIGCAIPARFMGFNVRGALRIGIGMLPRGEVALIIAGIGLATHTIDSKVFGVAIMMMLITTLMAPPMLVRVFQGPSGIAKEKSRSKTRLDKKLSIDFPSSDVAEFVLGRIVQAFRREAYFVHRVNPRMLVYQMRREEVVMTIFQDENSVVIETPPKYLNIAHLIVAEEMLELGEMIESLKSISGAAELGKDLLSKALGQSK